MQAPSMKRLDVIFPVLIVALSAALALATIIQGPQFHADDAYIVARYADNLVRHGQLVWNVGEAPVEGFTGYTLLIGMTIASWLHVPPLATATTMGVVSWFVGARVLYACHEPLGVSRFAGAVAASIFLCAAEQSTHAISGLETEFFIVLTIACAMAAVRRCHSEPGAGRLWPLPVLAMLCALTRPEGIVMGGSFLLFVLIRERMAWRAWLPVTTVGLLLPWGALQVFRRFYFGNFFPNTYYAKLGKSGDFGVFLASFGTHAEKYVVPALVAMIVVIVIVRVCGGKPTPLATSVRDSRRVVFLGAAMSYVIVAASYVRSDLVMNYSERFAYHFFGLSSLIVLVAVGELHRYFRAMTAPRVVRSCMFVLVGICLYLPFAHALEQRPRERIYRYGYSLGTVTHYVPVAQWLQEHFPPHATLAVYPDAGIVPYSTRLRTVDFGKLNDAYLAHHAHDPSAIVDYFFRENPDALMIYLVRGFNKTYDEGGDRLLADPRFSAYQLTLLSVDQGIGIALFVKR